MATLHPTRPGPAWPVACSARRSWISCSAPTGSIAIWS